MAKLIKTNGEILDITPKDGVHFTFEEMHELIGCEYVQLVSLSNREYMIVDEEGALKPDRIKNEKATIAYQKICLPQEVIEANLKELEEQGVAVHRLPGNEENFIYGNAILSNLKEIE